LYGRENTDILPSRSSETSWLPSSFHLEISEPLRSAHAALQVPSVAVLMKSHQTLPVLLGLILLFHPSSVTAGIVQNSYGRGDGEDALYPVPADNLLATSLASVTRTGEGVSDPGNTYFYRETSGYTVDLSRLYDGQFGPAGTYSDYSVFPNQVSITFYFDLTQNPGGFDLATIQTYAGWDSGRDGQAYTVEFSTAADPNTFSLLASITPFDNTDFPNLLDREMWDDDGNVTGTVQVPDEGYSATMVQLTNTSGLLASNVAALRFNFDGVENHGTSYREIVVQAIPEPSVCVLILGAAGLLAGRWRRKAREGSSDEIRMD